MWKLLHYDLKRHKRYIQIFAGTLLVFMIFVLCLTCSKHASEIAWEALRISLLMIETLGFLAIFPRLYENRFMKDDMINYTSISAVTRIMEPILFTCLYMVQWLIVMAVSNVLNLEGFISLLFPVLVSGYWLLYWIILRAIGWSKQHTFLPWTVSWTIVFFITPKLLSEILEPGVEIALTMGAMGVLAILLAIIIYLRNK